MSVSAFEILETVVHEVGAGRRVALCAIVATRGSTPQPAGTIVCVDEAACLTGTLGGGCVEADVRRQAHQLLEAEKSEPVTFTLDNDFGYDDGMICGGSLDVAIEVLSRQEHAQAIGQILDHLRAGRRAVLPVRVSTSKGAQEYRLTMDPAPTLVIAGAGHIGKLVAQFAVTLGFAVNVIDDRGEFANARRLPAPIRPVVGDIAKTLSDWPIDSNTYIVIVTRGHLHDERALQSVLGSEAAYIGMIGSKRKIAVIVDDLMHAGATAAQLDRVDAPIGLDIGAVTPEEIACSIAAKLVAVRRKDYKSTVDGPFPVAGNST